MTTPTEPNRGKTLTTILLFVSVLTHFSLMPSETYAHEVNVHEAISSYAANGSPNLKQFLKDIFGSAKGETANSPVFPAYQGFFSRRFTEGNAFVWIAEGAIRADDGLCFLNHFYSPLTNGGLTDNSEGPWYLFGNQGSPLDSFTWASQKDVNGTAAQNKDTWQNARDYQFSALTGASKTDREKKFAHTFESIGQVIHLLQDLSQPSHTRNDNHYKKRYIENYGKAHYDLFNFPLDAIVASLDWQNSGFTKLRDFWDRDLYTGASADALNNDSGQQTLGLSEFSNGNFLSEDRLYTELFPWTFPYPSLSTSTNFDTLKTNPTDGVRQVILRDGTSANRIMISKTADGISVTNHAALSFLGYKTLKTLGKVDALGVSIADEMVLSEYHSILIPKAVSYSGGLIDYYFRGKLKIKLTWDEGQSRYKLSITNASSQKFKGGAFTLYSDDQNGNRSTVVLNMANPWSSESTLETDASVEATFQAPSGTVAGYMLVYKGTIGTDSGGDAADPIDDGIAIAAHELKILRFNIKWDLKSDIDLYLTDPDGAIIWYSSRVSELGELDIDNIGNTGPENITLKTVVDGEYQVWANYYRDHYIEDPNSVEDDPETAISVTLKTYFNSSTILDTNTFTLTKPNYGADRPVGTTGPATQPSWYIRKQLKVEDGKVTQH